MLQALLSIIFVMLAQSHDAPTPSYMASIEPVRAILSEVVGDRASVSSLLPVGASPHTFEPKPSDLIRSEQANALFYVSPQLDGWATRLPIKQQVAMLPLLPESMRLVGTAHHEHDHVSEHGYDNEHRHVDKRAAYDPHFWSDPVAVKAILPALTSTLCQLDAPGCSTYKANAESFGKRLDRLNEQISTEVGKLKHVPFLSAQPFFMYFFKRYEFKQVNLIETIPGKEPTPKSLAGVIRDAKKKNVRAILTQRQLSNRAARVVAESIGVPLIEVDPLGGAVGRNRYEDLMRYNLAQLKKALP